MATASDKSDKKISFKETLNLPKTDFPIRSDFKENDARMIARWEQENLFSTSFTHNKGAQKFILHDGPPFVNGPIHLGHAFNKILKDMIAKTRRMAGKHVPVTPGWDCHGLPIEIKVAQEYPHASRIELIAHCRSRAQYWSEMQCTQFKQLGVLMDWGHPYSTMSPGYESSIIRAFAQFCEQGFVERNFRTIPWCAHCQTALAAAEIEYKDRKDPSLYVWFALHPEARKKLFPLLEKPVGFLVWTTTPWTLPLNRAVALKPATTYDVLVLADGRYAIVAQPLKTAVAKLLGISDTAVMSIKSDDLIGARIAHPIVSGKFVPVIAEQGVSLQDGTACVHCAPGCGPDDYEMGIKNNLEIYSPLAPNGTYAADIEPAELAGMSIADAQGWVITHVQKTGSLVYKENIVHSYPHCWRCRNGLMFRATKQWFLSLHRHHLREKAIQALDQMSFLPETSKNHLRAALESRLEWCISRQRVWGVPIPALLCTQCDEALVTPELLKRVAAGISAQGIEYWDLVPLAELTHNARCARCGSCEFKKEQAILDVWFDSGISHYAVLKQFAELAFPADIYCEARDQARGWFQSSLLTSMALEGQACVRTIVTHGYTVDEKGQKMSKSVGNVIAPQEIINEFGVEVLRLWVASLDYADDLTVSRALFANVQEVYRKIRNTARFLLANLYDFSLESDAIDFDKLLLIDAYALHNLFLLHNDVRAAYERIDFTAVFHRLTDYCTNELSALYLDIIKDRLYVEQADGHARRSAQTVCWHILDTLTKLMAPILSITAEQISDHYQHNKKSSIHVQNFPESIDICRIMQHGVKTGLAAPIGYRSHNVLSEIEATNFVQQFEASWQLLLSMRAALLKAIEAQRESGAIKHSLEVRLICSFDDSLRKQLAFVDSLCERSGQPFVDFLREFLIVSQVELIKDTSGLVATTLPGLFAAVTRAQGEKCPRCWQYSVTTHEHHLCNRCTQLLAPSNK